MMESDYTQLICCCGNKINYVDKWFAGCRDNDDVKIKCCACSAELVVNVNGMISDLVGAEEE